MAGLIRSMAYADMRQKQKWYMLRLRSMHCVYGLMLWQATSQPCCGQKERITKIGAMRLKVMREKGRLASRCSC